MTPSDDAGSSGAAQVGIAGHGETPGVDVAAPGREADPDRHAGLRRWRDAIVDDADRTRSRADDVAAVVGAGERERLAEAGRAREQVTVAPGLHPAGAHGLEPGHGRRRAQEDGG